jgi:hypothetical protein
MRPGQVLSYGFTGLHNPGPATVRIDRVGLADPRGLKQLAAWVVPGHSVNGVSFLYGVLRGYPPARSISPGVDWAARLRARGALLDPMKKPVDHTITQQDTLLLVIKLTGRKGTAKGITIWYQAGGTKYFLQTATSLIAEMKCSQ